MKRVRALILGIFGVLSMVAALALSGCSTEPGGGSGSSEGTRGSGDTSTDLVADLVIVAATELKDLRELVDQASRELGFSIEMYFPGGTLDNSQALHRGEFDGVVDATWFATNRYTNLIGAQGKLADETKIATSPIAFGVWEDTARRLGWDAKQPTWADFAAAAEAGEFRFGMTNPASSNSGFSALVSVATAIADTGEAITPADLERISPTLEGLFKSQSLVSGSSGWLADAFAADPSRADGIINYESTLHQLREQGQPIRVIVPSDGVISADYPLSTLADPKHPEAAERVEQLAGWLLEHQSEIAQTYRRPVSQVDNVPAEIASQQVIELPFPANQGVVDELIYTYNNQYRRPGATTFVLDTSGSMAGERISSLQSIMLSLIDGTAATNVGDVSLRDNEQVTIQSFSDEPHPPVTATYNRADPQAAAELRGYVESLRAAGGTALYPALLEAMERADTSAGIPSIVLLGDGQANIGENFTQFAKRYRSLPADKRGIPVFVILYGSANTAEMERLAELTGGAVFDAVNGDLDQAFKEIRGFQ